MTNRVLDIAFNQLIVSEGGYVNDPDDPGGETKYGVSKRAYPNVDIKNLTIEQAKEIYCKDYWDRCKCGQIPDCLSIMVADTAYNSGCNRAIKLLQQAVNVKVDGIIGNGTLCAVNSCNREQALETYADLRLEFLQSLKTWKKYGKGWTNRVEDVQKLAKQYI